MAGSFNGIGTTYYGECDYRADGTYVTTEWFIIAFFPVFPIASHRVARNRDGDRTWGFYNTTSYFRVEKLRVNWRQALRTWGFAALCIIWSILAFPIAYHLQRHDQASGGWLTISVFGLIALPWFIPIIARRRARRRLAIEIPDTVLHERMRVAPLTAAASPAPPPQPPPPPPPAAPAYDPNDHERFKPRA